MGKEHFEVHVSLVETLVKYNQRLDSLEAKVRGIKNVLEAIGSITIAPPKEKDTWPEKKWRILGEGLKLLEMVRDRVNPNCYYDQYTGESVYNLKKFIETL